MTVLEGVKKEIGVIPPIEYFDSELILFINSELSILAQLGVGDKNGYSIKTGEETWEDLLPDVTPMELNAAPTYVGLRVKLVFDTPGSAAVINAIKEEIRELGERLYEQAEERRSKLG